MLVLSRKENEDILIGEDVVVRIVGVRGDKVRIGIEAPPEIEVDRREVRERKERERLPAIVQPEGFSQPIQNVA